MSFSNPASFSFRLEEDHIIFQKLAEVVQTGFWNLKDRCYLPMAQEVLDVIYQVSFRHLL